MNVIKYSLTGCGCLALLATILMALFGTLASGNQNNSAEPPPQVAGGSLDGGQQNANGSATNGGGSGSSEEQQTLKKRCGDIPEKLIDAINSGATSAGLSPAFIAAIAKQESAWRDDVVYGPTNSSAGAQGMMQILPGTWQQLGGSGSPFDPQKAAYYGAKYLSQIYNNHVKQPFTTTLYSEKAVKYTAAGYNAGPGRLSQYQGPPPYAETQNYIKNVWAFYQNYARCLEGGDSGQAGGSRVELARQILNNQKVRLLQYHVGVGNRFHPASTAYQNILDTSQGSQAILSPDCGAGNRTDLAEPMLRGVIGLAQKYSLIINLFAGGCHSQNSRHYAGRAVDIGAINGQLIDASHPKFTEVIARCRELGAVEALGPGDPGHSNHIHCGW